MSSAFAGGHQLQRTQGTGVPTPAERARGNSVFRRLADLPAAVKRCTSGHEAAGKVLRRATDGATCPQATVSRNPSDLHCVCDGSQCQRVSARPPKSTSFLRVFEGLKPSRTASGHAGSLPKSLVCLLLCALMCPLLLLYTISLNTPYTPPSLSLWFSESVSISCVLSSLSRSAQSLSLTTSRSCSCSCPCSCSCSRSLSCYLCLCVYDTLSHKHTLYRARFLSLSILRALFRSHVLCQWLKLKRQCTCLRVGE